MATSINPEDLKKILPEICDKETSQDPNGWTPDNPLWGHCAVVSLVAQNLFGGELLRASLAEAPRFEHMRSHYWNQFPDGGAEDFTRPQFEDKYPTNLKPEPRDRSYVLSYPETVKRYKLLTYRLAKKIHAGNPLFDNPIYQACFYSALDSPCQKMWFGCVIVRNGEIIYRGCNKTIEPLRSFCEPECARFKITSRTESMLGACGHAEEWGLWELVRRGIPPSECDLYIAGLYANVLPWLKKQADHTCLRCAVQIHHAQLKSINVPVIDRWASLTPKQALETARAYALQEKKV